MELFVLLMLAWLAVALPTGLLVGRLLSYSSRNEEDFGRAAHEAMSTGHLKHLVL
jgi:hypothetical protein